jgi:hypothetical protein
MPGVCTAAAEHFATSVSGVRSHPLSFLRRSLVLLIVRGVDGADHQLDQPQLRRQRHTLYHIDTHALARS